MTATSIAVTSPGTISPMTELGDDPEASIATAIDALRQSGDTDLALNHIYSAIAGEGRSRSGQVNSLHLQSAALRLGRGEIDVAISYLTLALGLDDHDPSRDHQAFGVPASGAPFMPVWPATIAAGALVVTIGAALIGRLRRVGSSAG